MMAMTTSSSINVKAPEATILQEEAWKDTLPVVGILDSFSIGCLRGRRLRADWLACRHMVNIRHSLCSVKRRHLFG